MLKLRQDPHDILRGNGALVFFLLSDVLSSV